MGYVKEDHGLDGRHFDLVALTTEFTIGLMISAYRGIPLYLENQKNKFWQHSQQQTLSGKTIAVIGNGHIGKRIPSIKYICPRTNVINFSKTGSSGSFTMDKFYDNIEKYDVIVVLVPLDDSTKNMINKNVLSRMKDGSLLVNMSKGLVVNTNDLVEELNRNRIFAAIDQVYPDPLPPGHPLWDCPNLIITPHVGSNAR